MSEHTDADGKTWHHIPRWAIDQLADARAAEKVRACEGIIRHFVLAVDRIAEHLPPEAVEPAGRILLDAKLKAKQLAVMERLEISLPGIP